jgi:hypothetical protein
VISDTNLLRKVFTFGSPAKYHEILDKKAGGRLGGGGGGFGSGSSGKDFISSVQTHARTYKIRAVVGPSGARMRSLFNDGAGSVRGCFACTFS